MTRVEPAIPIPGLPGSGPEAHFFAPWQAKVFALTVALQERGLFTWTEWTENFAKRLRAAPDLPCAAETADHAAHYFSAWLETLEGFLLAEGTVTRDAIYQTTEIWQRAAEATPHGQPILFENGLAPPAE